MMNNFNEWVQGLTFESIQSETKDDIAKKHFGDENGVEDGALIDRLIGRDISETLHWNNKLIASAFTIPKTDVLGLVREALADNYTERQILRWSSDGADYEDFVLEFPMDESIGKAFIKAPWHNWNSGASKCHGLRIVLSKDGWRQSGRNFYIKTLYPYPDEEDLIEVQEKGQKVWSKRQTIKLA